MTALPAPDPVPLRLLLVRHGLSSFNTERRIQGRDDLSSLTDEGRLQARLTGSALADLRLDAVYSSPLSRAANTAAQLLEAQLMEAQAQERLAKQLMEARGKAIGACTAKVQRLQQALAQATLPGVGWDQYNVAQRALYVEVSQNLTKAKDLLNAHLAQAEM